MKLEKYLPIAFIFLVGLLLSPILSRKTRPERYGGRLLIPPGAAISGASVIMTPVTGSPIVNQERRPGQLRVQELATWQIRPDRRRNGFTFTKTTMWSSRISPFGST